MWRIKFMRVPNDSGIARGDVTSNTYTLPQAVRMIARWSPSVRDSVRIVKG